MIRSVAPFGDAALLVEVDGIDSAHQLARAIGHAVGHGHRLGPTPPGGPGKPGDVAAPTGIDDVVVGYQSVLVRIDPTSVDPAAITRWLSGLVARAGTPDPALSDRPGDTPGARRVEIPTTFDGPDLDEVAENLGASPSDVVAMLCAADLTVAFVGFSPGFPYLTGLPEPLAAVQRRTSPRTSVPAGSVAIAGGFASVYPSSSPGGWMLLGRTDVRLFDPDSAPYALLEAGDSVRFVRQSGVGADGSPGPPPPSGGPGVRAPLTSRSERFLDVLEAGLLTLVQDGGRRGVGSIGVPVSGAADPDGLRLANRLVGNDDTAACLEVTARGPTLRSSHDAYVAVVAEPADAGTTGVPDLAAGAEVHLDGRPAATGCVVPIAAGQVITIDAVRAGLRAYLAVSGGLHVPRQIGSMATDVMSGLGPGPLRNGDRVGIGEPGRPHGTLAASTVGAPMRGAARVVRVISGPHEVARPELEKLAAGTWQVGADSNRVGLRLSAPGDEVVIVPPSPGVPSCGMVTGGVQVPPDGRPIVLMPDHATVGGYPAIACVITADLGVLGRLRPGDLLAFEFIGRDEALAIHRGHERSLAMRVNGWYPMGSST